MYHVELRQFPHNACAFNLDEGELMQRLVLPWSREQWVELGERRWSPHRAHLIVLEGPHMPVGELSMGRGWRNAQRRGEDVTERLLAQARALGRGAQGVAEQPAGDVEAAAGETTVAGEAVAATEVAAVGEATAAAAEAAGGVRAPGAARAARAAEAGLGALLGADPDPLLRAWRLAAERRPELAPSESLALAERTLRALDDGPS